VNHSTERVDADKGCHSTFGFRVYVRLVRADFFAPLPLFAAAFFFATIRSCYSIQDDSNHRRLWFQANPGETRDVLLLKGQQPAPLRLPQRRRQGL
jgi:hypothetical protein